MPPLIERGVNVKGGSWLRTAEASRSQLSYVSVSSVLVNVPVRDCAGPEAGSIGERSCDRWLGRLDWCSARSPSPTATPRLGRRVPEEGDGLAG